MRKQNVYFLKYFLRIFLIFDQGQFIKHQIYFVEINPFENK
jgi:hypothetical protein